MIKIVEKPHDKEFFSMVAGTVFEFNDSVFIKTDERTAVNLETGFVRHNCPGGVRVLDIRFEQA